MENAARQKGGRIKPHEPAKPAAVSTAKYIAASRNKRRSHAQGQQKKGGGGRQTSQTAKAQKDITTAPTMVLRPQKVFKPRTIAAAVSSNSDQDYSHDMASDHEFHDSD